jgi:hypothetical protein
MGYLDQDHLAVAVGSGHDLVFTIARAHFQRVAWANARCGDPLALASDLGGKGVFDQAIADFSAAYTDKNEGGFALLEEAVTAGRISIQRGL